MSPLYIVTNGDGGNCYVYKPSHKHVSRAASTMLQTFLIIAKRSVKKYKLSGNYLSSYKKRRILLHCYKSMWWRSLQKDGNCFRVEKIFKGVFFRSRIVIKIVRIMRACTKIFIWASIQCQIAARPGSYNLICHR